jgi:membrane-associated phospholipid phosphatase
MASKTKRPRRIRIPDAARNATALEKADVAAAQALAPYEESLPVRLTALVGKLGDQPPMRIVSGGVLALGLVRRDVRMIRAGFRMLVAHTLATLAKDAAKKRVDRTRPRLLAKEGRYKMKPGRNESKEQTSFPSGHSAGAMAVAASFARDYPEHKAAAYGAGAAIALAQVPRHTHYPTDVGAGIAIGLGSEALVGLAMRKAGFGEGQA